MPVQRRRTTNDVVSMPLIQPAGRLNTDSLTKHNISSFQPTTEAGAVVVVLRCYEPCPKRVEPGPSNPIQCCNALHRNRLHCPMLNIIIQRTWPLMMNAKHTEHSILRSPTVLLNALVVVLDHWSWSLVTGPGPSCFLVKK